MHWGKAVFAISQVIFGVMFCLSLEDIVEWLRYEWSTSGNTLFWAMRINNTVRDVYFVYISNMDISMYEAKEVCWIITIAFSVFAGLLLWTDGRRPRRKLRGWTYWAMLALLLFRIRVIVLEIIDNSSFVFQYRDSIIASDDSGGILLLRDAIMILYSLILYLLALGVIKEGSKAKSLGQIK